MSVRLIATDLDGTLFDRDHRPAPRTVEAVNAARAAGIRVVAVSGRSHFSGADQAVSTGARLEWFIGSNGGHRLHYESGVIEERLEFPSDLVHDLFHSLPDLIGPVGFGWEVEDDIVFDPRFVELSPISLQGDPRVSAQSTPEGLQGVGKIFVAHPEITNRELVDHVRAHVDDDVIVTTSGAVFVEITPVGADKASGLSRLCEQLEIEAEDVVAFGDNQNDLTMLAWAGRGIAMGNAAAEVQAAADEVTESNAEHGVARVIEELLT